MDNYSWLIISKSDVKISTCCGRCEDYQKPGNPISNGKCKLSELEVSAEYNCHILSDEFIKRLNPGDLCPIIIQNVIWNREKAKHPEFY